MYLPIIIIIIITIISRGKCYSMRVLQFQQEEKTQGGGGNAGGKRKFIIFGLLRPIMSFIPGELTMHWNKFIFP